MLTDNLYNGDDGWLFGLKRFTSLPSIRFEVKAWSDNITGVESAFVKKAKQQGPAFEAIKVLPQYTIRFF